MMEENIFGPAVSNEWKLFAPVKIGVAILLGAYFTLGPISAYRAFYQVKSLEIGSSDSVLQKGSVIDTRVESYARGPVDVQLVLVQGAHSAVLDRTRVPNNDFSFWDPRTQRASMRTVVSDQFLSGFQSGPAQLRATALGRAQWTRVPPPLIRELVVELP